MTRLIELSELQQRAEFKKLAASLTDEFCATLYFFQDRQAWGASGDPDEKTLWNLAVLDGLVELLATHAAIMVISPNGEGGLEDRLIASETVRGKFFPVIAAMIREELARMKK